MNLTIGIDFDDTFTADPELWARFNRSVAELGHRLIMFTARRNTEENRETVNALLEHWQCTMPVVFTELGSKLLAAEKRGVKVDIWIDDDPRKLVNGH